MQKTWFLVSGIVLVAMVLGPCSSAATGVPTAAPSAGVSSVPPAGEIPGAGSSQPASALASVPLCQNPVACQAPAAELHEIGCSKKIPYANVRIPASTRFEILDKSGAFACNDSGNIVDGKTVLTCYGTQLHSFELKLTNPACDGTALTTGTGRCEQGYGYDAARQCCAPVIAGTVGSTTVKVDLGGCPLPQDHAP